MDAVAAKGLLFRQARPSAAARQDILVSVVMLVWWLIPWLSPFYEPYVGFLWSQPVFPSLHTPGTLTFFLVPLTGNRFYCRYLSQWRDGPHGKLAECTAYHGDGHGGLALPGESRNV